MFTYTFSLQCYDQIKEVVLDYMQRFNTNDIYAERVVLPQELIQLLEQELSDYGLPGPANFLAFKRKNYFSPRLETVHIDFYKEMLHSSIVLPVENYKGTAMFWMNGDYILETRVLPTGDPYQSVVWKSDPNLIEKIEITQPTLCKVDIPHDALSNLDGSYRTILSIRLKGNPLFEDIVSKLNANK